MSSIEVKFTAPAKAEVDTLLAANFNGKNPEQWHVEKVQQFAAANAASLPGVTQGRVRKPAHTGGTNPNEPEHITVTFKAKSKDIGTLHVYTGR